MLGLIDPMNEKIKLINYSNYIYILVRIYLDFIHNKKYAITMFMTWFSNNGFGEL